MLTISIHLRHLTSKVNAQKAKEAAAAKEADQWKAGSKVKDTSKEEKRLAELAKKEERARLLAAEEASIPKAKVKPAMASKTKASKKVEKPAGPGAIAAGGGIASTVFVPSVEVENDDETPVAHLQATGIDEMLEALEIANAKSDKAAVGQRAANLEAHPERRYKAALEAYIEAELPVIKKEQPGMRLQQYKERLFKQFQKHPDNPFNQVSVRYNADKEERLDALKAANAAQEKRLAL
ncbi:Uncharacterized conserved protein [Phaffia rhodozyma]|uniref:Uncharacterized conserved protein n=1 Tax=Phaffia rhodozyma TaxID=264483 RepID=A0A0F7SVT6_PHARH|nr:Uncharacterized conserved protein [Phaffia rhodozyma]